jgi:transporter family-2 protein
VSAPLAVLATVVAGCLVALQAPLNAKLADTTGSIPSALFNFLVGTLVLVVLVAMIGQARKLGDASSAPWYAVVGGGIMGVIYVTTVLITVREIGAAGATAATIAGQLAASLVLDRIGFLGLPEVDITPGRVLGVLLLLAGTVLVVK